MIFPIIRNSLISFVTVCAIIGASVGIIAYGRGYRFDLSRGSLKPTGLLVVTSDPSGAQILIDGKIKSATAATVNLPPNWYVVTVIKDGFQPWEKRLRVQGEVVVRADALLLPTNPSLTAITASGVTNPSLSPDGTKLAYVIPTLNGNDLTDRPGIYILELVDKPLGLNRDARQLAKNNGADFSSAILRWSPDSKQILAEVQLAPKQNPLWYLLEADRLNETPRLVADIQSIRHEWQEIKQMRTKEKFMTMAPELVKIATTSMDLVEFSPDETKILYHATASATIPEIITPPLIGTNPTLQTRELTAGNLYVYDIKEDRNYMLGAGATLSLRWLPTSRHLLTADKDKIEIMDYDGTNRRTAYAGPFWSNFAVPWTNGTKIVILTNLNPSASTMNNLYAVNLR